ncbi:MAG: Na+/Pi symporter [Candelina submexicana]|nr:MAG: Na+/Pi symporter [Candelina submexicana]
MAVLHQFDYIFAIGMTFAFLDAWNIGANDVANSFATSVSSRSLTLKQAMLIATVCEFAGAVLVGARVADTIRNKVLSVAAFNKEPTLLMLGMMCALIGSSTFLTVATKIGLPVSTTHCIVGGVVGVGIAALGADGVQWGWKGVAQIFAAWFVAPAIAGCFGAIVFSITKYGVLKRKDPFKAGLIQIPFYFALTSGILTMLIVWKGAASLSLSGWTAGQICGCIFGVALGVMALCTMFFLPYLHRRIMQEDWTVKWYHIFYGPLLLRRGPVPEKPRNTQIVQDYYRGHLTKEQLEASHIPEDPINDLEKSPKIPNAASTSRSSDDISADNAVGAHIMDIKPKSLAQEEQRELGPWYTPMNLYRKANYLFFRGVNIDVVSEQTHGKNSFLSGDIAAMHARTQHFDNKTEHMYSFLQVLTAATSSFAHGANDVSNALGPLSAIFLIWNSGKLSSKSPVPVWLLVYGAVAIVIGLWTYGYNIMRNLGNRLTLHSPSRGFSMELGSALTVVMATRLALPISTTQCITGATVGVGLCTGDIKAINWRMVAWIYMGWIITLPCTGIIAGCLMGIIINAPQWGHAL